MSQFKDRLWSELVRSHGSDLAQVTRPPARSRHRPRMLAGTGVGLAAFAGTVAALVLGTAGTMPAFAVTKNHDGSVTVWVRRITAIPAANARLQALGYRARLVQVAAGCGGNHWRTSIHGVALPPAAAPARIQVQARFIPRQIPIGRFLVIPAWRRGRALAVRPGRLIHGRVPGCLPLLPPPLPPRPGSPGGNYQAVGPVPFGQIPAACALRRVAAPNRQVLPPAWRMRLHGRRWRQQVRVSVHCPSRARVHGRGRAHRRR